MLLSPAEHRIGSLDRQAFRVQFRNLLPRIVLRSLKAGRISDVSSVKENLIPQERIEEVGEYGAD